MRTFTKWMLVIAGLLMLLTGVYAICNPASTLLSLAWIIGFLMLAVGIIETLTYFAWSGMLGSGWMLLLSRARSRMYLGCGYSSPVSISLFFRLTAKSWAWKGGGG